MKNKEKYFNYYKRKEQGITLVALVVTVILLFIITGVTLGNVLGENGLIEKAKKAITLYRESETDESMKIGQLANLLNDNGDNTDNSGNSDNNEEKNRNFRSRYR